MAGMVVLETCLFLFFTKESGLKINILGCSFDGCRRRMCHSVDMYKYFIVEKKEGFQSLQKQMFL
jgi:hypothetical protein